MGGIFRCVQPAARSDRRSRQPVARRDDDLECTGSNRPYDASENSLFSMPFYSICGHGTPHHATCCEPEYRAPPYLSDDLTSGGHAPMTTPNDTFYSKIPVFRGFSRLMDPALYSPLPDDWSIGVADIVESTRAIAEARYKAVNMAGASVIAAITNALAGREFPFVFGGDGASFAVSPEDLARAREALAATAIWVKEDLDLAMRVALVPVAAVRAQGFDVRVARFGPSPNLSYAMFSGGGLGWAETAMKRGELAVPARDADPLSFRNLIEDIITLVEHSPDAARPVPSGGPPLRWPPAGLEFEARAARGGQLFKRRAAVLVHTLFAYLIMRLGLSVGGFVPKTYVQQVVENSDFRKYDDGLRMILDCTPELEAALAQRLAAAASSGIARYGLHRQDAAMMTCFTPSALRSDHVHFIDGARGGYASAATALKAMAA